MPDPGPVGVGGVERLGMSRWDPCPGNGYVQGMDEMSRIFDTHPLLPTPSCGHHNERTTDGWQADSMHSTGMHSYYYRRWLWQSNWMSRRCSM